MMRLLMPVMLVFLMFSPVFGLDLPTRQIPDDSLLRIRLKDSWMTESPARVMERQPLLHDLEGGGRVEVRVEAGRDEFMVIFAREQTGGRIATEETPAVSRSGTGVFPGWAQGSWMLTRKRSTGEGTLIRIFLRSDQYAYIQLRPLSPDKSQMDVVLYGAYTVRSLPLAIPFERLYTMPVNEVLTLAGDKFPRRYFDPDPVDYQGQRQFIAQVRQYLPALEFADDGAIDENGNYVFIETLKPQDTTNGTAGLNCSGFAKWLIDGILRPVTGQRLTIPPLKAPFGTRGSSFSDTWEEIRDPFFGLDWIRNLAAEAGEVLRSPAFRSLEEFEVRADTFSQLLVPSGRSFVIQSYPGFLDEAGYGSEGIHPLLYTLAIDEPGRFYLAAISNEMGAAVTPENPMGRPRLRQYFHIAALIPYFDEYGVFRVVVFESAAETSFNAFKTRYPGHYINLVRIPVGALFEP